MTDDKQEVRANKLRSDRMQFAQQHFLGYDVAAEAGTTLADLSRPAWWANVAGRLQRLSIVRVVPDDATFFAEVLVTEVGTGFAKVAVLNHVDLDPASEQEEDSDFTVSWKGPHLKFAVVRKADKEMLRDGFVKKTDAEMWAREHRAAIGR